MVKFFVLQEPDWAAMMAAGGSNDGGSSGSDDQFGTDDAAPNADEYKSGSEGEDKMAGKTAGNGTQQQQQSEEAGSHGSKLGSGVTAGSTTAQQLQAVAAARRQALEARFGMLLRSKGFVWLATRGDHIGEWSQAGSLLSFSTGESW